MIDAGQFRLVIDGTYNLIVKYKGKNLISFHDSYSGCGYPVIDRHQTKLPEIQEHGSFIAWEDEVK